MTIADPKTYAVKKRGPEDEADELRAQLAQLQSQVESLTQIASTRGGLDPSTVEAMLLKVAQVSAEAQERARNPSNLFSPEISCFTYPEGDRKRPRAFKCPMVWAGYDMDLDTTTVEELELLNRAEPGVYWFVRTNGQRDRLTVTGDVGPDGKVQKLSFEFNAKENRDTLPGIANMLRSAFGVKTKEQEEIERLRREVEALRGQPAVA